MKTIWSVLAILTLAIPSIAMAQPENGSEPDEAVEAVLVPTPPAPFAQWLIEQTAHAHADVKALEVVADVDGTCRTIAATDDDEIGEKCGDDEIQPMSTGNVSVEEPSKHEPVYEVTSALHDVHGNVIGAVSMDIAPGNREKSQVLELAQKVRVELEEKLASKSALFAPAP